MATVKLIEYDEATPEVRVVYDDIMRARRVDSVNNFWKAIANDPATLRRTWESLEAIMGPGAIDALTKQLLYLAVSIANGCQYCIYSHTAAARGEGMSDRMLAELVAIVGMASETNRLADGYQVPVDEAFLPVPDSQIGPQIDPTIDP